jgi:ABC-type molybdate transport system substrate-binding protein
LNSPGRKNSFVLGRIKVAPTIMLFVLSFLLVFSSYHSLEQKNQTVNAQATGGDVNVLYAGSLISVMETKIGPAFSHLGYDYRGEGHGSIQDANMIIDGQRFPDVFISVGETIILL